MARAKDDEGNSLGRTLNAFEQEAHRYELDTFETVQAMALEGLGVGVLPLRLAERSAEAGHLLPVSFSTLGKKFGRHRFYCSVLAEDLNDARLMAVIKELRAWCGR